MASVTINIPDTDVQDAKAAAASYANLPVTSTAKELIAAVFNIMINNYRQNQAAITKANVS